MKVREISMALGGLAAVVGLAYARTMSGSLSERDPRTKEEGDELWVWNWKSGGYNTAFAPSRESAMRAAIRMGAPRDLRRDDGSLWMTTRGLEVDAPTLRKTTWKEVDEIDRGYGFD